MKCFVIMPFGNPRVDAEQARKLDSIYSKWIKPTVESISIPGMTEKLMCHRADKISRPGEIISHVIENLVDSNIVIADLSGRNPNVFYELGVRHAVNNNTILIADDPEAIPFDLRGLRTFAYEYEPDSMLRLKAYIEKAILEILNDPDKIDNPVRTFLYNREIQRLTKQSAPSLEADVVKSLLSEMAALRTELTSQTDEVRQILKLITAPELHQLSVQQKELLDFRAFEGVWINDDTSSIYYAKVVNEELRMPYSYGMERDALTGHYYNCRIIGDTLFARFEWFMSEISGYSFWKLEHPTKIVGGWWYSEDVPKEVLRDFSRINPNIPKMNSYVLKKVKKQTTNFPEYVEEYFETLKVDPTYRFS